MTEGALDVIPQRAICFIDWIPLMYTYSLTIARTSKLP